MQAFSLSDTLIQSDLEEVHQSLQARIWILQQPTGGLVNIKTKGRQRGCRGELFSSINTECSLKTITSFCSCSVIRQCNRSALQIEAFQSNSVAHSCEQAEWVSFLSCRFHSKTTDMSTSVFNDDHGLLSKQTHGTKCGIMRRQSGRAHAGGGS